MACTLNRLPLLLICLAGAAAAAEKPSVILTRDVAVKMRDGVVLRADVFRPNRSGAFPVLLERTPYNKDGEMPFGFQAAEDGFIVVIQDVRGRYKSPGEWYPFKHESEDGYDTVEWAAALPHSNGKVGMFGGSYVGATQMLTAIAHPPHLAGICPRVTASNYHEGWTYQGGAFEQWFNESWTSGLAEDTLYRRVVAHTDALNGIDTLPLTSYVPFPSPQISGLAPYFDDWLHHPTYDDYWKRWSIEDHYADIQVPALTTAAWYDIFLGGSLRNYLGLKAHGRQHLIISVGGHSGDARKVGDVDFGPEAAFDEHATVLAWYEYLFQGAQNEFAGKPVRIFVMGKNQWRDEDDWPLTRAQTTPYFLGHTTLSRQKADAAPDQYTYDPAHPVPTVGGPLCCDSAHLAPGPKDQSEIEKRDDVLLYSTDPLDHDLEVTGPVKLVLYAKSSAPDTDFTAKLVDVSPSGFAQNIAEGIVRARYRNSQTHAEFMQPGEVYRFEIDLTATSNVFLQGHRIRLEVSSSNFPRFDRNLNTTGDPELDKDFQTATNTVLHDSAHPSALLLPIVP